MADKFVVVPSKKTKAVVMSIRIDKEIQEEFDELAKKSDRSRNELINMALRYAIDNLEFISESKEDE